MADATTTILESIGVYLPANAVATDEVLRGCKRPVRFPLEQLTGIRSRRMAGEGEYSFELARNAVAECLANSSKTAQEIELLVCCNISRYDAPLRASYEPCAAVLLKKHFSLARAMCFDINNACAGMFTGLYLIDALIKAGLIRCGMAVSGEYITHLTRTAQMEIAGYMDPQLACLTLGDAGAAAILEASSREGAGWHAIDLYTIAKYSPLCIAKPTQQEHGGAVMSTASITATAAVVERSAMHAVNTMLQAQRPLETIQHIIPHQTSRTTLQEGLSEIARLFDRDLGPLLINNLAERGNTASNTHFVALCDQIERGRIRSGDSLMFCISGSGMTIGTAIYTLDDLPDRLARGRSAPRPNGRASAPGAAQASYFPARPPRLRVESAAAATADEFEIEPDTQKLAARAAKACLAKSSYGADEIDLLLSVGQYRSGFIAEPAAATMTACDLAMNEDSEPLDEKRTLAFDVLNGPLGLLNACCLAAGLIQAGKSRHVMVVASETQDHGDDCPPRRQAAGAALILDRPLQGDIGFGPFLFKDYPQHADALTASADLRAGQPRVLVQRSPDLEDRYVKCIADAVDELLHRSGMSRSQIAAVFPPQISPAFVARLGERLGFDKARVVDVSSQRGDLFTSSIPYALQRAQEQQRIGPGEIGLLIAVSAGIQVGCALYHF